MAPTVAAQGQWFVGSVLLGVLLALIYHFLRAFRHHFPMGTILADLIFLCFVGWGLAYLGLVVCGGIFQLPQVAGLGLGAWVYRLTLWGLLQGVFSAFWGFIRKIWSYIRGVFKKILKKLKKTAKFLFSSWEKWVTIKGRKKNAPAKKRRQRGKQSLQKTAALGFEKGNR